MFLVLKAIRAAMTIFTAQQNPDRCYYNWELVEDDLESSKYLKNPTFQSGKRPKIRGWNCKSRNLLLPNVDHHISVMT